VRPVSRAAFVVVLALAGAACASNEQAVDDSDAGIKARIEIALRGRKDVDPRFISVDVEHGVVTLSGIVPAPEQRVIIDRIVKRMSGVDTLLDNLLVQD
jgi:osmotically-inducible protein OsmY